jgi:hypothetical protein
VLAAVHVVQQFRHYILLRKTTVFAFVNPFQYVLMQRINNRNINRWIIILQEFDLDFVSTKSKKSLVFVKLISKLPVKSGDVTPEELPIKGDIFMITSLDPWYGDILVYLQSLKCLAFVSFDEHR